MYEQTTAVIDIKVWRSGSLVKPDEPNSAKLEVITFLNLWCLKIAKVGLER